MLRPFLLASLPAAVLLCASPAAAQPAIRIQGGAPVLTVSAATPGNEPAPVSNAASQLRYRRQSATSKVTVTTACPGQKFTLQLVALNPDVGTAMPPVTLTDGMPPRDLVTGIPPGNPPFGRCVLQYTAVATFAQGNSTELGPDAHLVTFTLVAQ